MKNNFHTKQIFPYTLLLLFLAMASSYSHAQTDTAQSLVAPDSLIIDTMSEDSLNLDSLITSPDALESKVTYKATDSIRIDMRNELVYLFGSAEVYYDKIVLKAEEIEISMDSNEVTARGKQDSTGKYYGEPVFSENGQEVKSHEMRYNFETKKGLILSLIHI